jgi:hypothetical protein
MVTARHFRFIAGSRPQADFFHELQRFPAGWAGVHECHSFHDQGRWPRGRSQLGGEADRWENWENS